MDAAVVLGHEAELVGFGLHLHGSFAGHLVIPLRSSYLRITTRQTRDMKHEAVSHSYIFILMEEVKTHLDHIGIESSAEHGGHQPDVF